MGATQPRGQPPCAHAKQPAAGQTKRKRTAMLLFGLRGLGSVSVVDISNNSAGVFNKAAEGKSPAVILREAKRTLSLEREIWTEAL